MPLTEQEKNYVVEKVVEILRAPDREARLQALREQCLNREGDAVSLDDAAYSVLQAVEELYGTK
jgi:hypothetical protein